MTSSSSSSEDGAAGMSRPVAPTRAFSVADYSDLLAKATKPRGGNTSQSLPAASATSDLSEFSWVYLHLSESVLSILSDNICLSHSWGAKSYLSLTQVAQLIKKEEDQVSDGSI